MVQYDCSLTSLSINIPAVPSLLRPLPLQFHDGLGFLVSHSLITNTFEFSLQRVNPKLTVPYWDFTIETTPSAGVAYDPNFPFTRTELLRPSWFGTADSEDSMVRRSTTVFISQGFLLVVLFFLFLLLLWLLMLAEFTAATDGRTSVAL